MITSEYNAVINDKGFEPSRSKCQRVDENGEVIIAEAVCNRRQVCMRICCLYYLIVVLSFFILSPVLCVMGLYFGVKASSSWRLYLTPTGIHYTRVAISTCCYQKIFIPLSDIEDVFVQHNIVVNQGSYAQSNSVNVRVDRSKIGQYKLWYQCLQSDYLELHHIENASDFAAAINRQLK
jgi:hypothetical protein